MKNNLYKVLLALMLFALVACQPATPTPKAASEFFRDKPDQWISVNPPDGWTAHAGGSNMASNIIVSDDWDGYKKTNTKAIGIIITQLKDEGSAEDVLRIAIGRLGTLLTVPNAPIKVDQVNGQSRAFVEYQGKSAEKDTVLAYYFLAVISNGKRNILVLASVEGNQEIRVKPVFQSVMQGITVH